MAFFDVLKNKISDLFYNESIDDSENNKVHVSMDELVREQYNINGLNFFKSVAKNMMAGTSASPFKGKGMEFDEVRTYHTGDDVRSIDWRVTARCGETYTKLFKEERERQVVILTDMRSPMHFATRGIFKSVMAARLSALISWAALDSNEKVGGIVVSDEDTTIVAPHRSRKKVLSLLGAITKASFVENPKKSKKLHVMFLELRRAVKTGGIVFIISDFHDFDEKAKQYITQISSKCDVVVINIIDRIEGKAPPEDRYLVTDGKKTMTLFADDFEWREKYESYFKDKYEKFDDFCVKRGIKNIWIKTNEKPDDVLKRAFSSYAKRKM